MPEKHNTISSQLENTQEITAESLQEIHERRRHTRRSARWYTTITTRDKVTVHCRTRDVSEKGAAIDSPADFRAHAMVIVEIASFYKGIKKSFKILAEIKHSAIAKDGFTLGICFKDASKDTYDFFRKYVEEEI